MENEQLYIVNGKPFKVPDSEKESFLEQSKGKVVFDVMGRRINTEVPGKSAGSAGSAASDAVKNLNLKSTEQTNETDQSQKNQQENTESKSEKPSSESASNNIYEKAKAENIINPRTKFISLLEETRNEDVVSKEILKYLPKDSGYTVAPAFPGDDAIRINFKDPYAENRGLENRKMRTIPIMLDPFLGGKIDQETVMKTIDDFVRKTSPELQLGKDGSWQVIEKEGLEFNKTTGLYEKKGGIFDPKATTYDDIGKVDEKNDNGEVLYVKDGKKTTALINETTNEPMTDEEMEAEGYEVSKINDPVDEEKKKKQKEEYDKNFYKHHNNESSHSGGWFGAPLLDDDEKFGWDFALSRAEGKAASILQEMYPKETTGFEFTWGSLGNQVTVKAANGEEKTFATGWTFDKPIKRETIADMKQWMEDNRGLKKTREEKLIDTKNQVDSKINNITEQNTNPDNVDPYLKEKGYKTNQEADLMYQDKIFIKNDEQLNNSLAQLDEYDDVAKEFRTVPEEQLSKKALEYLQRVQKRFPEQGYEANRAKVLSDIEFARNNQRRKFNKIIEESKGSVIMEDIIQTSKNKFVENLLKSGGYEDEEDKQILSNPRHEDYDAILANYMFKDGKDRKKNALYSQAFRDVFEEEKNNRMFFSKNRDALRKELDKVYLDPNATDEDKEIARQKFDEAVSNLKNEAGDGDENYEKYGDTILQGKVTKGLDELAEDMVKDLPTHLKEEKRGELEYLKSEVEEKIDKEVNKIQANEILFENTKSEITKKQTRQNEINNGISELMETHNIPSAKEQEEQQKNLKAKFKFDDDEKFQENIDNLKKDLRTEEQFNEGYKTIEKKYNLSSGFPSQEEMLSYREELENKVKSGELKPQEANSQWTTYYDNIQAASEELNAYRNDYITEVEAVNEKITSYVDDQQTRRDGYNKEINKISKKNQKNINAFNEALVEKFGKNQEELNQEFETLDSEVETLRNSANSLFDINDKLLDKLDDDFLAAKGYGLAIDDTKKVISRFSLTNLANVSIDFLQNIPNVMQMVSDVNNEALELMVEAFGGSEDTANLLKDINGWINPFMSMGAYTRDEKTNKSRWTKDRKRIDEWQYEHIESHLEDRLTMREARKSGQMWLYGGNMLVEQAPVLVTLAASGGTAGLVVLGANSAGGKYMDMQDQKDMWFKSGGLYGHNHSMFSMVANATVTGVAEGAFERYTAGILGTTGKSLGRTFRNVIGEAATSGIKNIVSRPFSFRNLTKGAIGLGKEWFQEGTSELLTSFAENAADIIISGRKDVHILDNLDRAFVDGVFLSGLLQSPRVASLATAPFTPNSTKSLLNNNISQMNKISNEIMELRNSTDPSDIKKRVELETQHAKLMDDSSKLIELDIKRVDVLHPTEKNALIEIDKRNNIDAEKILDIKKDDNLSKEERTKQIKEIQGKIDARNSRKQQIIDKYPPNVVDANYRDQVQTLQATADLAKEYGAVDTRLHVENQEKFQKRVAKYSSKEQNKSIAQVKSIADHFDAMAEGLNEIINDPDSTPQEIKAAKELLNDANGQINIANNILKSSDAGVMQPRFRNGKIVGMDIAINRDAVMKNGMFNTAAHEFIHATFRQTLKADPAMRKILGAQVDAILDGNGIEMSDAARRHFNNRIQQYPEDQRGEEKMAIASEMMFDGTLKIKEGALKKLGGVWRRFSQHHLGAEIKFDTTNDIRNFMIDYHKSVKNNKVNPAIAKMLAKGANGKIFKDVRTPIEKKNQAMFSRAVKKNLQSNPDLRQEFDDLVSEKDGSPKHENHEDFKASPEYIEGFNKIMDSKLLDGLIKQGMTERGLPSQALKDFTRDVKERIGDRYLTNFNLDKNDSLFGWLTGVSGGAGKSIIYRAKGDVINEYIKQGKADDVSLDKQVGEGGTLADIIEGDVNQETIDKFNNQEIKLTSETDTEISGIKVKDAVLPIQKNKKSKARKVLENTVKATDYSDQNLNYKSVNQNLTEKPKVKNKKGKLVNPTKASDVNPTGSLYPILEAFANEIGVDPLRLLANQNLNKLQRNKVRNWIKNMSINPDGSFNDILFHLLPDGQDRSGRATGIADTVLGQFYTKGERARMSKGATGAGLPLQMKRTDVSQTEFLDMFGINPDGTFEKTGLKGNTTDFDGALRQLVIQMATTLTVTELTSNGNANNRLNDGLSQGLYSKTPKTPELAKALKKIVESHGKGDTDVLIDELIEDYGVSAENAELLANMLRDQALQEFLQAPGGYNEFVMKFLANDSDIAKMFQATKKGDKFRNIVDKFTKVEGYSDKGYPNKGLFDLGRSAEVLQENFHPNILSKKGFAKLVFSVMGIKDSGLLKVNGKILYIDGLPVSSTRTLHPIYFNKDIQSKVTDVSERKFMEDELGMTDAEITAIENGDFAMMEWKGEIKKTMERLWNATSIKEKLDILTQESVKIKKINSGNKALHKYIAGKQKQLFDKGEISKENVINLNQFQTNIVEGTRALSTLSYIYLADGPQLGEKAPAKTKNKKDITNTPEYRAAYEAHINSWKNTTDWKIARDIVKKENPKLDINSDKFNNKVINLLKPKNEHLTTSAETHARKAVYTLGGNQDLNNLVSNHQTFYGPKFITDKALDAKVKVGDKFVDNKVNLEGVNRLVKFAKGYQKNIYNATTGETVAVEVAEGLEGPINEILQPTVELKSEQKFQELKQTSSNSLSSKTPPKTQGLSVFDFDDTLGITKSGVRVTMPNPDGTPKPKRKVVFLAGGAGSGKGNVIKKLGLEKDGFKIVNSDISLEWLKKNNGLPENMRDLTKEQRSTLGKLGAQARKIARNKMMKYQGDANGVVVDGTGGSAKQMQKLVKEFQDKGYDVSMVFVETSLDTAIERNRARKERSLLDVIVRRNHDAVQGNKPGFKELFGNRFMEVKTDNLEMGDPMPKKLVEQMDDFVSGYEKRRLDAAEFAEQGDAILDQGGKFDFSEFDQVIEGRPGPLLDKAKQRASKYGTKDIFVLTARTQKSAKAIQQFLKSQGLNIPLENITGLADSTGAAKADWMLDKFAEGYNDMYFADDATQNVEAVKEVLDQLDIKSDVVQAKLDQTNRLVDKSNASQSKIVEPDPNDPSRRDPIDKEFNDMIERKKGVDSETIISEAEGRRRGKETNIIRFLKSLYIPPSAEDFKGLLYYFVGKGKQGDADLKWFKEKILDPFAKGIRSWNAFKQNMVDEYQALQKKFPKVVKSLNKVIPGTAFTNDTAVRVYLFEKAGHDIPGISNAQKRQLIDHVANNPELRAFADGLSKITRSKDGYPPPTNNWAVSSIPGDMNNLTSKVGRKQFLQEWINLKNNIFSQDNLNKIRATYGDGFADALENILYRMENGGNRVMSKDKTVNRFTEWINGSVGAIMFFNMRSALLQTISTVNFINWNDNNIFKASAAFANQPQFWKDFVMLFNSPQLKQRRKGLQTDVSASELTKSFAEGKGTPRAVINYLLSKGFTPTQIADSFAIAFGGATFYRNRFNKYKKEGMTDAQANEQTMLDFQEIAEETQQSSREDLVSQQQASVLGRIVLAFQNVTMQMGRLTKKSMSDLINGRGDFKTNVSKILYYGMVQNIVFASLQTALAAIAWGDDEEEIEERTTRTLNQALDSFLRGTGLYGALLSTLKNTIIQWNLQKKKKYGQQDTSKIALELINLSPPIGSKIRKIINAFKTEQYNKGVSEKIGFRIENPELYKWANIIEAATNIPLARVINKANNLEEALTGDHLMWQRVALIMGWNKWDLGVKDEELEKAKEEVREEKKEEKRKKKEEKKKEEKKKKEEEKKKEEQEKKEKGIKTVRCSGIRSNGRRCGNTTETNKKSWKCPHHRDFVDGSDTDGDGKKEYRCTATKSNGQRCKNKTENTNKKCYAHQ